jgi:hypothetical protein
VANSFRRATRDMADQANVPGTGRRDSGGRDSGNMDSDVGDDSDVQGAFDSGSEAPSPYVGNRSNMNMSMSMPMGDFPDLGGREVTTTPFHLPFFKPTYLTPIPFPFFKPTPNPNPTQSDLKIDPHPKPYPSSPRSPLVPVLQ